MAKPLTDQDPNFPDSRVEITSLSWGEIEVSVKGKRYHFRDCKIWPDGAGEWDWNASGTHHSPGIQIADVAELIDRGSEVLILALGQQRRFKVKKETREYLDGQGIIYFEEDTIQAVEHFNHLSSKGEKVGGVFHTTC